jgi:outer membrane protein assembly factor BamB
MRAAAALVVFACGGASTFTLTAPDNDPAALARALAAGATPAPPPRPAAYLVTQDGKLVGWSLADGKAMFATATPIGSRVVVGAGQVVAREGAALVARGADDGRPRWSHPLAAGTFLGLAADGDRAYYVVKAAQYHLIAVRGGTEIWRSSADGSLGAPAARGGLVFMPFLNQWLTLLDGATGATLARIRLTDEAVAFVHADDAAVTYGSRGLYVLDAKSASGSRAGSTYLLPTLPPFGRPMYAFDAYGAAQASYGALDRSRLLWQVKDGAFAGGVVTWFHYRYLFAFDAASGALRWAYLEPRGDIAGAEDTGAAIVLVTQAGDVVALDRATGAVLGRTATGERVAGTTIAAGGFRPAGQGTRTAPAEVLAAIIADRDARFPTVKQFAVETLGRLGGADVTAALIHVLRDEASATEIRDRAADVLEKRTDETGLPAILAALSVHASFLTSTYPRGVDVLARAVAALGLPEAGPALVAHLDDPATPPTTLAEIVRALVAIRARDAFPELRSFLLLYRCDPTYENDPQILGPVIDAVLALGGGAGREAVAWVADEPRTVRAVATYAKRAVGE